MICLVFVPIIKEFHRMETIMDNLQVEISLAFSENEDFEHEGYYNNIDEAIEALKKLKEYYRQIVEPRCNICVYNPLECNGNDNYHCCPHYKRAMSASYPLHDLGAL